jgi:deazaflavin-dependent oxidoreductase (nitroreductase family)
MTERSPRPYTAREERVGTALVKVMSRLNIWAYRATGGRVGGRFLRGAPVLLLTTQGRRSGRPRTAPLLYLEDGGRIAIVASKGGMSQHPLWYRNLRANPRCEVEIGRERRTMLARVADAEERRELWPKLVAMYRDYDGYQARTDREIPVVLLMPSTPLGSASPRGRARGATE